MARNRKTKQKASSKTSLRKHGKTLGTEETPTDPAGSKEVPYTNRSDKPIIQTTTYNRVHGCLPFPPSVLEQILFFALGGTSQCFPLAPGLGQPYRIIRWKLSLFRVSKAFSAVYKPVFYRQLVIRDPTVWNRLWDARTGPLTMRKETAQLVKKVVFDYKAERQKSVKLGGMRRTPKAITPVPPKKHGNYHPSPKWLTRSQWGDNYTLTVEIHHAGRDHIDQIMNAALADVSPTKIYLRNPLFRWNGELSWVEPIAARLFQSSIMKKVETLSVSGVDWHNGNLMLFFGAMRNVEQPERLQVILAYDADVAWDREMVVLTALSVVRNATAVWFPSHLLSFLRQVYADKRLVNIRRFWLRRVVGRHLNGAVFGEQLFRSLVMEYQPPNTWKGGEEEAEGFIKWCTRKVYSYPKTFKGQVL